jgi:hypothetical protein
MDLDAELPNNLSPKKTWEVYSVPGQLALPTLSGLNSFPGPIETPPIGTLYHAPVWLWWVMGDTPP